MFIRDWGFISGVGFFIKEKKRNANDYSFLEKKRERIVNFGRLLRRVPLGFPALGLVQFVARVRRSRRPAKA
ncbi:hypothetical protein ACVGV7_01180, partial [Enterobacter intestinihominis]